jgi:chromate reductase
MTSATSVAVLVGSLRAGSFNRQLAQALAAIAPPSLKLEIVEIGDLPFYNQDLETDSPPPAWTTFRQRLASAGAVLFLTPEYNRSVPAVLKNAVDVGSRPYGRGALNNKVAAVISVSPGAIGGFGANHHLRQSLAALGVAVLPAPEAYIGGADKLFADDGSLAVPATREFLQKFLAAFEQWIARHGR